MVSPVYMWYWKNQIVSCQKSVPFCLSLGDFAIYPTIVCWTETTKDAEQRVIHMTNLQWEVSDIGSSKRFIFVKATTNPQPDGFNFHLVACQKHIPVIMKEAWLSFQNRCAPLADGFPVIQWPWESVTCNNENGSLLVFGHSLEDGSRCHNLNRLTSVRHKLKSEIRCFSWNLFCKQTQF